MIEHGSIRDYIDEANRDGSFVAFPGAFQIRQDQSCFDTSGWETRQTLDIDGISICDHFCNLPDVIKTDINILANPIKSATHIRSKASIRVPADLYEGNLVDGRRLNVLVRTGAVAGTEPVVVQRPRQQPTPLAAVEGEPGGGVAQEQQPVPAPAFEVLEVRRLTSYSVGNVNVGLNRLADICLIGKNDPEYWSTILEIYDEARLLEKCCTDHGCHGKDLSTEKARYQRHLAEHERAPKAVTTLCKSLLPCLADNILSLCATKAVQAPLLYISVYNTKLASLRTVRELILLQRLYFCTGGWNGRHRGR